MYSVCIYIAKNVGYDLSVRSMSVMGFQKKSFDGWVGGVCSIQVYCGILLTLQSPLVSMILRVLSMSVMGFQ